MTAGADREPRVVVVETSPVAPGLLPFAAWEALTASDLVLARDPEGHPSRPWLYQAGVELGGLEPAGPVALAGIDLMQAGSPTDRALARALCDAAGGPAAARDEAGGVPPGRQVAYLRGPDDGEELIRAIGMEAAKRHVEVEFVFLAELPQGTELLRLVEVERRLRDPETGCPWDLEQDHATLGRYLVEEAHELLHAIDTGDDTDIREELGDVLLQVVFHAQVAADRRAFTIDDVARGIADKLVRRHPHVFGDVEVADAAEVTANWEELKAAEKPEREGPFDGVPMSLPALQLAEDLQRKAARTGFRWDDLDGPVAKVREELDELLAAEDVEAREAELGDLLLAVVAVGRQLEVEPEAALRRASTRFRTRVEGMLDLARQRGVDTTELDADAWLALWDEARERHG
ncbi:MAG: nucleoside triphosphate pyrophosphohydrolase [Actinomycetes bacterium]